MNNQIDIAEIERLFTIIKANCKNPMGQELYRLAFRARAAIKYGSKELAQRTGWEYAKHLYDVGYADTTGVLVAFACLVEKAYLKM